MQFEEAEILTCVLALGVLVVLLFQRAHKKRVPKWPMLASSFISLFLGTLATVVEGIALHALFNFLEHFFLLLSAVFLTLWCWMISQRGKG